MTIGCFKIEFIGFKFQKEAEWKRLADQGCSRLAAVELRRLHPAKDREDCYAIVDAYMKKRGIEDKW